MNVRFSDGRSLMRGGPIDLIRLGDRRYVVGRGYLCEVESEEEGTELMTLLRTAREGKEPSFDSYLLGQVAFSLQATPLSREICDQRSRILITETE